MTVRPAMFWSPSLRVRLSEKEVWAPAVEAAEAAWKPGLKGRGPLGQGVPLGPWSTVKNCLEVTLDRAASQGVKTLWTS